MFSGHPSTGILGLEMASQNSELFLRRFLGTSPGGGSVAMVDVTDVCPYKRCPYCMSPTRKAHFASPCTICGGPYKPTETPAPFQGERRCRPKNSATGARHARQNRNSLSCLDWLLIQFGRFRHPRKSSDSSAVGRWVPTAVPSLYHTCFLFVLSVLNRHSGSRDPSPSRK